MNAEFDAIVTSMHKCKQEKCCLPVMQYIAAIEPQQLWAVIIIAIAPNLFTSKD